MATRVRRPEDIQLQAIISTPNMPAHHARAEGDWWPTPTWVARIGQAPRQHKRKVGPRRMRTVWTERVS